MRIILITISFITTLLATSPQKQENTLVFGIVPQQSPQKIYKAWHPFIEYLSEKTGINIVLRTERSIPEFEKNLYSGKYDIAYSNPYHYTLAHKKQKHNAIVRFDKQIVGILVVHKESKIKNLNDVKNKEFLFPAPKAFAATLLTKYEILNTLNYDVDKADKFRYVNSHDSVYLGILRGFGEVGGGIQRTFNKFKHKDDLRVIYTTKKYPSHPISVRADLDQKIQNKIEKALLEMPKQYIKPINKKTFKKTNNDEYLVVKQLAIQMGIFN